MQRANTVPGVTGVFLFVLSAARGQAPPKLEFDVASVRVREIESISVTRRTGTGRPCATPTSCLAEMTGRPSPYGGPGTADPGRMTFRGVSMEALLMTAFGVHQFDQISAPDSIQEWLVKTRFVGIKYDIMATFPAGATKEDAKEMLKKPARRPVWPCLPLANAGFRWIQADGGQGRAEA